MVAAPCRLWHGLDRTEGNTTRADGFLCSIPVPPPSAKTIELVGLLRSDLHPHEPLPLPKPQGLHRANHNLSFCVSQHTAGTNCQLARSPSCLRTLLLDTGIAGEPSLPLTPSFREFTSYKFILSSLLQHPLTTFPKVVMMLPETGQMATCSGAAGKKNTLLRSENSDLLLAEVIISFQAVHNNFSEGGKSCLICTAQKTTLFSSLRATYPKNKTDCHQHSSDTATGDCWHCEQSTLSEGTAVPSWRNRG